MRAVFISGAVAVLALPARAECLGSCMDQLETALATVAVYGVTGIVLLVMLIVRKWRRAGLWSLAVAAVLALGVPLASQAWQGWALWRMQGREVTGTPPAMAERVPLLIPVDGPCRDDACSVLLGQRGRAGTFVLPPEALAGVDLAAPLMLTDLPLELWIQPQDMYVDPVVRLLTPEERQAAVARIDYLVITAEPNYLSEPGPIEAALAGNPALAGRGPDEVLRLAMAPLAPGVGRLSLADLRFDLLDLSLMQRALALPLAPLNRKSARNSPAGVEAVIKALCPWTEDGEDWACRNALQY